MGVDSNYSNCEFPSRFFWKILRQERYCQRVCPEYCHLGFTHQIIQATDDLGPKRPWNIDCVAIWFKKWQFSGLQGTVPGTSGVGPRLWRCRRWCLAIIERRQRALEDQRKTWAFEAGTLPILGLSNCVEHLARSYRNVRRFCAKHCRLFKSYPCRLLQFPWHR